MKQEPVMPNPQQVVTCIDLILKNSMLAESHAYLEKCERHPEFVRILFNIFEGLELSALREAVYLFAVNVVKRNTHHNRRASAIGTYKHYTVNLDAMKPYIKDTLIRYCRERPVGLKWSYLKDLLRYISHIEYPQAWPALQQLLLTNLERLFNAKGALDERLLEDVDLVRVVMKGEGKKSSFLKKDDIFVNYTMHIARPVDAILTAMDQRLSESGALPSPLELKLFSILDRTALSCLSTIKTTLQSDVELANVVGRLLARVATYLALQARSPDPNYTRLLLKGIKRILLYAGVLQSSFPLLFAPLLPQYMSMLVNLIKMAPQLYALDRQQLVAKATMMSLSRILRTYAYYADSQTFAASIMSKSTSQQQLPLRQVCHKHFMEFFSPTMIEEVMSTVVANILGYRGEETEDELEEQQATALNEVDHSPANIGSGLLSLLMDRFKVQCAMLIGSILNNLISGGFAASHHLQSNTYYMLELLPNVYQEQQLPMDRILTILEHLYRTRQLNRHFALMASRYYVMFTEEQLQRVFDCLIEVTIGHTDQITVFESCKTLALILTKKEGSVKLTNLPKTILTVIQMFPRFKNPTALRHLLKVINNILSNVQFDSQIVRQCVESPIVHDVLRKPEEALVYLLCEFLQGLIVKTSSPQITKLTLMFLEGNLDKQLDNPEVVYQLWVATIRNYQPGGGLQHALIQMYHHFIETVADNDSKCYCQLLLEHLLLKLVDMDWSQLTHTVLGILRNNSGSKQGHTQAWALYFYYSVITPNIELSADIIESLFLTLNSIDGHPNAQNIQVQSNIINIINLFLCRNPAGLSAAACRALQVPEPTWIEIWLKHSRLLYTYESEKLLTVTILQIIDRLAREHVADRFQWFVRVSMLHLDPTEIPHLVVRKGNPSRRRQTFRRHVPVMEMDLKPLFKQKFPAFLARIGIAEQFIRANIKSEDVLQRLIKLLS